MISEPLQISPTSSIKSVTIAAILGGLLAMIVILLFLGSIRRSLIVTLMIPVAIIATFVLMNVSGLTLNIMSLGGLALGVGLLIDNAIVMIWTGWMSWQEQLFRDYRSRSY